MVFDSINQFLEEIETLQRGTVLGAIYDIGHIVGLDWDNEYAEE